MDDAVLRLRRRMLGVIGLSSSLMLAACGREELGDEGGSGSGSSSTSGSGSASTPGPDNSGPDDGPDTSDPTSGNECGPPIERTVCVPMDGGSSGADSGDSGDSTGGSETTGTDDDSTSGGGMTGTGGTCEGVTPTDYSFCVYGMSEVFEMDGQCCAVLEGYAECCDGRPFFVHGEIRTAPAIVRDDWCAGARPAVDALSQAERDALAAAWRQDAAMEHASVASFTRFALQLLALGAGPDLLADTQRAIADEIEHAKLCFALASAYTGHSVGPGRLDVDGAMQGQTDLLSAAVSSAREGCIGETIAALQAEIAASKASDPVVRAVLQRIADDEARHAELAWRFVQWAIHRGGDPVRAAVAATFATAPSRSLPPPAPIREDVWGDHGRLTPTEQADLVRHAHTELLAPLAAALLGTAASDLGACPRIPAHA